MRFSRSISRTASSIIRVSPSRRTPIGRRLALPRQTSNYMRSSALRDTRSTDKVNASGLNANARPNCKNFPYARLILRDCSDCCALIASPHHARFPFTEGIPAFLEGALAGHARDTAPVCDYGIPQPGKIRRRSLLRRHRQTMEQTRYTRGANLAETSRGSSPHHSCARQVSPFGPALGPRPLRHSLFNGNTRQNAVSRERRQSLRPGNFRHESWNCTSGFRAAGATELASATSQTPRLPLDF